MEGRPMNRAADGAVAGVLKGIATYFGWETRRLRIAYVILTVGTAGFPGVVLYACLWWLMPPASRA
jgi:phage shock protein C